LLDRLACDVITLAPLRARPEDIELLAEHFGQRIARELEGDFPGWSREAMAAMRRHAWPGNVRELKNTAERATFRVMAAQANGAPLGPVVLTTDMLDPFASPWRPAVEMTPSAAQPSRAAVTAQVDEPVGARAETAPPLDGAMKFEEAVQALEKQLLEAALAAEKGHQRKAADRLGLSYHQMRGLLRKYGYGRNGEFAEAQPLADPPA
jgi:psp operon transcriptional activator